MDEKRQSFLLYLGLSCCLAFLFLLFFFGGKLLYVTDGTLLFTRFMAVCLFMGVSIVIIAGFTLVRFCSESLRARLLCTPVLVALSVLTLGLAIASAFDSLVYNVVTAVTGISYGLVLSFLISAWVKHIASLRSHDFIPALLVCSGTGAALCALVLLLPFSTQLGVAFALVSSLCFAFLKPATVQDDETNETNEASEAEENSSSSVSLLSSRIKGGTVLYGIAAGITATYVYMFNTAQASTHVYTLVFLALLSLCATQLSAVKDEQTKGNVSAEPQQKSHAWRFALCYTYQVAICLFVAGLFLTPVLGAFAITGESIALAGYFGIVVVFSVLFLIVAHIAHVQAVLVLADGFRLLFAGVVLGILFGYAIAYIEVYYALDYLSIACAGVLILLSYNFFFTHQDFVELTAVAGAADNFEDACRALVEIYALSKREAEVLPLALKGRTAERIAGELFVSKSTIDTHLRRIYTKCNVHTRQELIDLAEATALEMSGRYML